MENNDTIKCTEIIPTELDSSRLTVLATQKTEDMELNGVMVPCLRVDDKINTQEQTEGDIKTKLTDEIPEVKMILKGENHISSLTTDKETNLEKDYFTELEMKNNFMETENGAQAIEGSSNIKQHCSHVVELDTSNKGENSVTSHRKVNEESKLEADEAVQMNYRGNEPSLAKSDTSSDSSEDESSSESSDNQGLTKCSLDGDEGDDDEDDGSKQNRTSGKTKTSWPQSLPRTKGELSLDDLPPIEELAITVGDDVKMVEVGKITSAIHTLVIVQAKADLPPLNEDTVLFLEERKVLGQVFETFGPVSTPLYSVRFNSPDQINERQLRPGLIVFYVPDAPEYTHYVFMAHLQSIKASDASWEHNNEPPPQCIDYSDDEEERRAKGQLKQEKRNRMPHNDDDDDNRSMTKGKKPRRKPKGTFGHQEKTVTPNFSQRGASSGTDMWPPKDYQSWPPSDRMVHTSQNGIISSQHSHSSVSGTDNSGAQRYKFTGTTSSTATFINSHSQERFGRGQHIRSQISVSSGSLLGTPPPGVTTRVPSLSVMQPGPPGMGPTVQPPSFLPRHQSPMMPPYGSPFPGPRVSASGSQSSEASCSVLPPHVMSGMPRDSHFQQCHPAQELWHQPHSPHFNPPSQSIPSRAQSSKHNPMLPPHPQHMRPPPLIPQMRPDVIGIPYVGNRPMGPGFNGAAPYSGHTQQQFGGAPRFTCGPVRSFRPPWGGNQSYH